VNRYFFSGFFVFVCIFLANCTQQTWMNNALPEKRHAVFEQHHSASEEILTCLKDTSDLSDEQIEQSFVQQKESFIKQNNTESRSRLICLSLARLDKPGSMEYAKNLMLDAVKTDACPQPDVEGLLVLISKFQHLQQTRNTEISRAQKQVTELKKKLEELKTVEEIIRDRKNDY